MAGTVSADIHTTLTDAQGHPHTATPGGRYLALLSLTALGIVYGDIGTSPLYAMRECFHGPHAIDATPENVFGVMSLIFWALILIISIKYCVFVLRADNRGEGGILALTALATPIKVVSRSERVWLVALGIFGAALLYGDGIITPAISVLGAVEGLNVATPFFAPYVVPLTVVIIVGLFLIQSRGTAKVGRLFGPVMLVWFLVIAALGVAQVVRRPSVVAAFSPVHALDFSCATAGTASSSSGLSSSSSRAARRSTPTWGTSASARYASSGTCWFCPPSCSTISGRARC